MNSDILERVRRRHRPVEIPRRCAQGCGSWPCDAIQLLERYERLVKAIGGDDGHQAV